MPTLMITAVFEGAPTGGLVPGKPIPDVAVEVGGLGRESITDRTDVAGTCIVEVPEAGSWTVHVTGETDAGSLLGIRSVEVVGDLALSAVPVRFRPTA